MPSRDADLTAPRAGASRGTARRSGHPGPERPGRAVPDVVVGPVPPGARLVGLLLVLAAVVGGAALLPAYLVVGGQELALADEPGEVLVGVLPLAVHAVIGALLLRGAVPKLGLAYAAVGAAPGVGALLIEVYRGTASTSRPGTEVLAGEVVLTSSVEPGPGWTLAVASLALLVAAGALSVAVWGRTRMEDSGTLDPARPALAGAAVVLGVLAVLCLALPPADVPGVLQTDPVTGFQVVVEQEGPQGLLERPGPALLGGLLLAGAVVLGSVVAPSLRPRLAAVGGLLALTVTVLGAALGGARDAAGSPALEWTLPGAALLVAGLGYAGLTVLTWRLRRPGTTG